MAVFHTDIKKRDKTNHLDHIIPIALGYKYNIDPNTIGHIKNLRIISHKENFKKNSLITNEVLDKLKEFNIDIANLNIVERDIITLKESSEIIETPVYQVVILNKHRLTTYPKGNKR